MQYTHVYKEITPTYQEVAQVLTQLGYKEEKLELTKKMNELTWLNFINPFGWALDGATGACIRYEQPEIIELTARKKTP